VDTDGTAAYSPVRTVRVSPSGEVAVFPTATADVATLDIRGLPAEIYTVRAVNLLGRECATWELTGGQLCPLRVNELAAGTYVLSFSGKGTRIPSVRLVRL
jgi:hypothetical protein